jgi:hypothetical protein
MGSKKFISAQKFGNLEKPDAQKIQENFFPDAGKCLGSFENLGCLQRL